ncbi:DOPO-like protein, partial [Mya arenaria]
NMNPNGNNDASDAGWLPAACMLLTSVHAYQSFKAGIPNGDSVPHPCNSSRMWEGVGHENKAGGGARNPFGMDFDANGKVWNSTICGMDSDGDGRTNGEELGDPDCVCEPMTSSTCSGRNSFVDCGNTREFDCPPIHTEDPIKFEVRFPETPVPAQETTYMCMAFEFPSDKPYHLIASNPIIANSEVMHHIIVYGCAGMNTAPRELNKPWVCEDEIKYCEEAISVWVAGGNGMCFDENMGFQISGEKGLKYAVLEFHWNNPSLVDGYTDSSGSELYLTPNLRSNNAGVLLIGQNNIAIPPGKIEHEEQGTCPGNCTNQIMMGDIQVTMVFNHMHLMGKAQITELNRNGRRIQYLAKDDHYDYNSPVVYKDPVTVAMNEAVAEKCTPFVCREECLDYVRTLKEQPCFIGDVEKMLRTRYLSEESTRNEVISFFAAIDSCDKELWME